MKRAVARFEVAVFGHRVRVRLLAGTAAVNAAWRKTGGLGRLQRGEHLHGFFHAQARGGLGAIVLAHGADLLEIVPHEAQHAALAALRRRQGLATDAPVTLDEAAEEYVATVAGLLTRRVLRGLRRIGVEVR